VKRISGEHVAATKKENMMQEVIPKFTFYKHVNMLNPLASANRTILGSFRKLFNIATGSKRLYSYHSELFVNIRSGEMLNGAGNTVSLAFG
jgi:hypothetical protein